METRFTVSGTCSEQDAFFPLLNLAQHKKGSVSLLQIPKETLHAALLMHPVKPVHERVLKGTLQA